MMLTPSAVNTASNVAVNLVVDFRITLV
jgi:hypothetical protein